MRKSTHILPTDDIDDFQEMSWIETENNLSQQNKMIREIIIDIILLNQRYFQDLDEFCGNI